MLTRRFRRAEEDGIVDGEGLAWHKAFRLGTVDGNCDISFY
jgi:hypothetical protein